MSSQVTEMSRSALRWVVILTGIGSLMAALDTLAVATALSEIRLDLGASVEQLQWTVNAYHLSFAVLLITGAALGDRFVRRGSSPSGWGCSRRRRRPGRWPPTSAP
jgi:MFS family permease